MKQHNLRVLMIIPGSQKDDVPMIFARRHIDSLEKSGLNVHRFFLESRTSFFTLFTSLRSFLKVQSEFKPDIVHCNYGAMTSFFSAVAAKEPLVITFRGSDLNPTMNAGMLRIAASHFLSQIASFRARRVICVSEQLRSKLWWPLARSRTTIIPSPVNLEIFNVINITEARRLLGWKQEDRVVLFNAGKAQPGKRLDIAQEAISVARTYISNIRFEVLKGNVPPEKIPVFMNASDCLLLTSDYEGSPNVVKEAMACNLPVVAVNVGDVPERLRDVEPSKIVERDPQALGKAVADILNQKCRSNGRLIAKRDVSQEVLNKKTMNVYLNALNRR